MIIFIHLQISICNDSGKSTSNVYVNSKISLFQVAFTSIKSHIPESAGCFTKKSWTKSPEMRSFAGC